MSVQPAPVAFAVEVDEGLGEEEHAAFNSVCEKVRDGLYAVEGASRLQKIKLVAPGVAQVYCKCTPGECAKSVKSRETSVLLAQLNSKIRVHLACNKCASSAAAPPPPSAPSPATSQPLEPTSEMPPPHPLAPYLSPAPPLANTTERVEKRVEKVRDYLQVTSAATAEQVRCAFLRRLGAADTPVGVAHVVHAYRILTGDQGPDRVTSDELEAAKRVRQADESFASWSSEQVRAALLAGLLEFSDARGHRFPREELMYSSAKGWSCSFSVEYHVEVVPPMVTQRRLARAAWPLNRLLPKSDDREKLKETFTKVPTRAERDKLLDRIGEMREGARYNQELEKLELAGCEEARLRIWRNARQSLQVHLPPPDKRIQGLPPCESEYARGCCLCCKEVDDEDAGGNRWILVTFDDTDVRELPPAYWQPSNPLKARDVNVYGVDATKPFWELPNLLHSACDCEGLCVCKSFLVRACLLASVRETGKPPAFLSVQDVLQPSPRIEIRVPLGYVTANGMPDVLLLGKMADGMPRETRDPSMPEIIICPMARADDLLIFRLSVPGFVGGHRAAGMVLHALLPSAYEPILAPLLRGTVSTAAECRRKQAVRENLANYSKCIIDKLAKPTNDLRASLGITEAAANALVGERPRDDGEHQAIYEALGPCSVATPTAIAFEATKQRKLQEAVDDAVHREVRGVLADRVGIVAAQEDKPLGEAGLRASMGLAEKKVDVSLEKQQRARLASDAICGDPEKRRELMQWLSTRQPGLFKTEDRFSSKMASVVKRRPDWLDGDVKRARCA